SRDWCSDACSSDLITTDTARHTNPTIKPLISPPVPKYGIRGPGVVQGTPYPNGFINPVLIAKYPIKILTTGVNTKGIIIIGFKTIGKPKIMGSLILNIPGRNDNLLMAL